jgi:hypothetical protein
VTTLTTEPFADWVSQQTIRPAWIDTFLADQLGGDEARLVNVTRQHTPFGTFTIKIEAAP